MEHFINIENEISGFKVTSSNIAFSTDFIAGIACIISKEYERAFEIHSILEKHLKDFDSKNLQNETVNKIAHMRKRLPALLAEATIGILIDTYCIKPIDYNKLNHYANLLLQFDPNNYTAVLFRAIFLFKIEKNVNAAKQELNKVKKEKDGAWLYSLAFLSSYEGNLNEAYRFYEKAFKRESGKHVILDVEVFIEEEIANDPSKFQLHYNLGLINYKKKEDYILAQEHFTRFVEEAKKESKFRRHVQHAEKYLREIDQLQIA